MSFIYQGLDTCGFDKEVQPCKEFIHSFIKFILSIHHSSYCILFLKMLYPMFQNAVSTIPYCCIPESLYPCYHVTMYPCIPVSLYPCIPVSLYHTSYGRNTLQLRCWMRARVCLLSCPMRQTVDSSTTWYRIIR